MSRADCERGQRVAGVERPRHQPRLPRGHSQQNKGQSSSTFVTYEQVFQQKRCLFLDKFKNIPDLLNYDKEGEIIVNSDFK